MNRKRFVITEMEKNMDISIIIPTYNKENRLDITLQSLVNDYKKK